MKRIAVVPAFEPDDKMITLLKELNSNNYITIVVNDGSSEKCSPIFVESEPLATVLTHNVNRGKGAALKTAYSFIEQNYSDYCVVTLDCDGQHRVKDANKLCDYIENHRDELVLGKRLRSEKTPLRSRIGNAITRFVYQISTGIDVYDTQTGLRAFSDRLIDYMLQIPGEGFEYEMNVLLACSKENIKIKEITIETIYFDNNSQSHFNTVKDSYRIYKEILKFSCVSLCSFIIDYFLYVIFSLTLKNIFLSNILARMISSTFNYFMNKQLVFKGKSANALIKYYLLVVIILLVNTSLLKVIVDYLMINEFIAKIIVEVSLFIISFIVQKLVIFKKK